MSSPIFNNQPHSINSKPPAPSNLPTYLAERHTFSREEASAALQNSLLTAINGTFERILQRHSMQLQELLDNIQEEWIAIERAAARRKENQI